MLTAAELLWWAIAWWAGAAPLPYLPVYWALALCGLAAALGLRLVLRVRGPRPSWPALLAGTVLLGFGASLFLPLKYAIRRDPSWLAALARLSVPVGADPWQVLDLARRHDVPIVGFRACGCCSELGLFLVLVHPPHHQVAALSAYISWSCLRVRRCFLTAGPIFRPAIRRHPSAAGSTLSERGAVRVAQPAICIRATGEPGFVPAFRVSLDARRISLGWPWPPRACSERAPSPRDSCSSGSHGPARLSLCRDGLAERSDCWACGLLAAPIDRALAARMTPRRFEYSRPPRGPW